MRFLCFCLSLLFSSVASAAEPEFILTVVAKAERRGHLPVSISLPPEIRDGTWELVETSTGQRVSGQTADHQLVFSQPEVWEAGSSHTFEIRAAAEKKTSDFNWTESGGDLTVSWKSRPILNYNVAVDEPPAGLDPLYRKSGYFHPVYSPAGSILTADFPADHAHQHGIFFAWVKTDIAGQPIDFWNQAKGTGTILHQQLHGTQQGTQFASFSADLKHLMNATTKPRTALRERWSVNVYPSDRFHIWELQSEQRNVLDVPVTLEKYHYGGMAFRGRVDWILSEENRDCTMLTSEGANRKQGNHEAVRWVQISGLATDGKSKPSRCGLVMMSHPENVRSPQKVRLHPTKPYFCFCPVVDEQLTLEPGDVLRSRYLMVTFDGDPDPSEFEKLWNDYACCLDVKID